MFDSNLSSAVGNLPVKMQIDGKTWDLNQIHEKSSWDIL